MCNTSIFFKLLFANRNDDAPPPANHEIRNIFPDVVIKKEGISNYPLQKKKIFFSRTVLKDNFKTMFREAKINRKKTKKIKRKKNLKFKN